MGNGYPAAAFGGRDDVMSVLPDKVSHGGTYAGNRVAAAAAVEDARDPARHRRARDRPCHRPARPGRPARGPQPDRPAVPLHRPPLDVRDHVLGGRSVGVPRLGGRPTTSCTTRSPSACMPAARCPSPTRANRGSSARPTPRATSSTGSSPTSRDSLDVALEARAHGDIGRVRDGAMAHPTAAG